MNFRLPPPPPGDMPTHFMSDKEIMKGMGSRLARHRLALNITQDELAAHAGISRSSVRAIERGDSVNMAVFLPLLRSLRLLHDFFASIPEVDVDMHWFIKNQPPERKRARREKPKPQKSKKPKEADWVGFRILPSEPQEKSLLSNETR